MELQGFRALIATSRYQPDRPAATAAAATAPPAASAENEGAGADGAWPKRVSNHVVGQVPRFRSLILIEFCTTSSGFWVKAACGNLMML